jgi:hypothetical protein
MYPVLLLTLVPLTIYHWQSKPRLHELACVLGLTYRSVKGQRQWSMVSALVHTQVQVADLGLVAVH